MNDLSGAERTGAARSINRQKLNLTRLTHDLETGVDHRGKVWEEYRRLLALRQAEPALNPDTAQKVLDWGPGLFVLLRGDVSGDHLYAVHNVTARELKCDGIDKRGYLDVLTEEVWGNGASLPENLLFAPYQARWLKPLKK